MKSPTSSALILAGLLAAGAAQAATGDVAATAPLAEGTHAPRAQPVEDTGTELDLRRWREDGFREDYAMMQRRLGTQAGPARVAVLLDFAEMYLVQMMLDEARSVLADTHPKTGPETRRWRALSEAAVLLSGEPVTHLDTSPLISDSRADRGLWLLLQAVARGDAGAMARNLEPAFAGLAQQSRAVSRALIPVLTEVAVEIDRPEIAELGLSLMADLPDTPGSMRMTFLTGRAAERIGNEKTALEAYFEAAKGRDRYAARARLALADMSLDDGGTGALLAAREVLNDGVESWRGDQLELDILDRRALVLLQLDRPVEALLALGRIIWRFPASQAAEAATLDARGALEVLYHDGEFGRLPLGQWVEGHLTLLPVFRHLPDFAERTEELADYAYKLGGTDLAATEYRRTLELLQLFVGDPEHDPGQKRLVAVRLKLANALVRAGLLTEALTQLDDVTPPEDEMTRERYFALKARIYAGLDDNQNLFGTFVARPDADLLRNMARALMAEENWPEAVAFYARLRSEKARAFTAEDASYMLIAAHRAGDRVTAEDIAQSFPGLTESAGWVEIARSMQDQPVMLDPLRLDMATSRLDQLDRVLENFKDTGL